MCNTDSQDKLPWNERCLALASGFQFLLVAPALSLSNKCFLHIQQPRWKKLFCCQVGNRSSCKHELNCSSLFYLVDIILDTFPRLWMAVLSLVPVTNWPDWNYHNIDTKSLSFKRNDRNASLEIFEHVTWFIFDCLTIFNIQLILIKSLKILSAVANVIQHFNFFFFRLYVLSSEKNERTVFFK